MLGSIDSLVAVLYSQGKYKEAEGMCRQMLELMEKILGHEHPDTLESINLLAQVL